MHVLYIHQHFAVLSGSTGTRSYEFAPRWVKAGHQVTIITGHYDIGGLDCKHKDQEIGGIKVIVAGAVAVKDVPSNTIVGGVPAKIIKKSNQA